jgi:hypothetical protein
MSCLYNEIRMNIYIFSGLGAKEKRLSHQASIIGMI